MKVLYNTLYNITEQTGKQWKGFFFYYWRGYTLCLSHCS